MAALVVIVVSIVAVAVVVALLIDLKIQLRSYQDKPISNKDGYNEL